MQKSLFVLSFCVLSLLPGALALEPQAAYISGDKVYVRAKPSPLFERLGHLKKGDLLRVVGEKDEWYEILLPPQIYGWVSADSLDGEGKVKGESCLLYAGPNLNSTAFSQIPQGTKLQVVGQRGQEWRQVVPPEGTTAWISNRYAVLGNPPAPGEEVKSAPEEAPRVSLEERARQLEEENKAAQARLDQAKAENDKLEASISASEKETAELQLRQQQAEEARKKAEEAQLHAELARLEAQLAQEQAETKRLQAEAMQREPAASRNEEKPAGTAEDMPVAAPAEESQPPAEEKPEELAAAAPAEAPSQEPPAPVMPQTWRGVVVPLGKLATAKTTHVLCRRQDNGYLPLHFLSSPWIDLQEWEQQEVEIVGKEIKPDGWKRSLLQVKGIFRPRQ